MAAVGADEAFVPSSAPFTLIPNEYYKTNEEYQEAFGNAVRLARESGFDAVEVHGEALEAHAEGVAAPDLGVVAHGGEHGGVDHAAAADLDPLLVL